MVFCVPATNAVIIPHGCAQFFSSLSQMPRHLCEERAQRVEQELRRGTDEQDVAPEIEPLLIKPVVQIFTCQNSERHGRRERKRGPERFGARGGQNSVGKQPEEIAQREESELRARIDRLVQPPAQQVERDGRSARLRDKGCESRERSDRDSEAGANQRPEG